MSNSRRESLVNNHDHNSSFDQNNLDGQNQLADPVAVALKHFVNDDRHFSLVRNFRIADLITIFNGVCGSLSIFSTTYFLITLEEKYIKLGCILPLLSLGFDFLDGKVARFRNESSILGQELDSLADLISFGVAPALIGFTIGLRYTFDVLILTFFVCAGLTRLARFNSTASFHQRHPQQQQPIQKKSIPPTPTTNTITSNFNRLNSFEGLPIPTTLWLVMVMFESIRRRQIQLPPLYLHLLSIDDSSSSSKLSPSHLNWLNAVHSNGNQLLGGLVQNSFGIHVHWFSLAFATWGFLMLSKTLKVPKL